MTQTKWTNKWAIIVKKNDKIFFRKKADSVEYTPYVETAYLYETKNEAIASFLHSSFGIEHVCKIKTATVYSIPGFRLVNLKADSAAESWVSLGSCLEKPVVPNLKVGYNKSEGFYIKERDFHAS